jgi:hypothetical protein
VSLTAQEYSIPISEINGGYISRPRYIIVSVGVNRAGVKVVLSGDVLVPKEPYFPLPEELRYEVRR